MCYKMVKQWLFPFLFIIYKRVLEVGISLFLLPLLHNLGQ